MKKQLWPVVIVLLSVLFMGALCSPVEDDDDDNQPVDDDADDDLSDDECLDDDTLDDDNVDDDAIDDDSADDDADDDVDDDSADDDAVDDDAVDDDTADDDTVDDDTTDDDAVDDDTTDDDTADDESGNVHVVDLGDSPFSLRHPSNETGVWVATDIDTPTDFHWYTFKAVIAVAGNGDLHVAYGFYDYADQPVVRYAVRHEGVVDRRCAKQRRVGLDLRSRHRRARASRGRRHLQPVLRHQHRRRLAELRR